jgi:hypothetical protein
MIQVIVEGHGEVMAMGKFLAKLARHLGFDPNLLKPPRRDRRLFTEKGIAELITMASTMRATGLLLIRDSEDDCPKELAPQMARFIENAQPEFPISYVLLYREFETLFLSVARHLAGKELVYSTHSKIKLEPQFKVDFSPELKRDAKGALDGLLPDNQTYKPTLHQLPMVSLIQMEWLEEANLPSFGSLKRALVHLLSPEHGQLVYPNPPLQA